MANSVNKQVSVNDVKNVKAVQIVSKLQALRLITEMKQRLQSVGGLRYVMYLTKNFAYLLSETKPTDDTMPAIKVGKKCFYLSPVGQVNEYNILNVVKSVLKVEDAKRILAKKLAKKLTFAQFCETTDTQKRIDDMKAALRKYANTEMSEKQEKDTLHNLYEEYSQSLGLEE